MITLSDIIAIATILLIVGGAVIYIVRAKRRGTKCIGCPHSGECRGGCQGCTGEDKKIETSE